MKATTTAGFNDGILDNTRLKVRGGSRGCETVCGTRVGFTHNLPSTYFDGNLGFRCAQRGCRRKGVTSP